MSHLFGGQPKVIPEFTGLQVNTAVQVLPIPIIYGSPRLSINVVYYNGFNVVMQKVSGGGGKGLLSGGKGGGEQVEYFATFIGAVGEGPIGDPLIIYQDQNVWTPSTYPTNGAQWFNGTSAQSPWAYVTTNWPQDSRSYKDTAYYAFANAQIDSSATIPQINLVVEGFFKGTSPLNSSTITITSGQYDQQGNPLSFIGDIDIGTADADPALCIFHFLTDPICGATFPSQWVDTSTLFTQANGWDPNTGDPTLSSFCQAVGIAWSTAVDNVESASSILDRWAKNLNTALVWNGAFLRFIPYWDGNATGNPGWDAANGVAKKYYTPYTEPVVELTMDYILQSEEKTEDPISFIRKDPQEVYNTVRLDFRDRFNFFNDVPAEAKDEAHIELYGPRIDNIGIAKEFTLSNYANIAATMILRRNISIMNTYTWKMGPLWGWLDPMDILSIPNPVDYSKQILVRVTSVTDDEDENITIEAEEYPVGDQSPSVMPLSPTTPPNSGATNSPPLPAYVPVIFEPTTAMLTAQSLSTPQVILGASAGVNGVLDQNYGGSFIWISLDAATYQFIGTIFGPSTIGSLAAPLPGYGGVNPDMGHTLLVNLSESDGSLISFDSVSASNGASLCCVQDASGFELITYTTATLVGPFTYALTGLYRGMFGTVPRLFSGGSRFLYVGTNSNIFETGLPSSYIGQTFWVKLQGFNVFRQATIDLADVVAYEFTVYGPVPPPPLPPPASQSPTYRRLSSPKATVGRNRRKKTV